MFNTLCRPQEALLNNTSLSERLFFVSTCKLRKEGNAVDFYLAVTTWILLVIFNIVYTMKEVTKLAHLKVNYFKEWESVLNLMTIVSFPCISFHQNPFADKHVVVKT